MDMKTAIDAWKETCGSHMNFALNSPPFHLLVAFATRIESTERDGCMQALLDVGHHEAYEIIYKRSNVEVTGGGAVRLTERLGDDDAK